MNRSRKIIFFVAICFIACLAGIAAFPYVRPFYFPMPTGSYAVGTSIRHWIDSSRAEPHSQNHADRRELMVQFWYPAQGEKQQIPSERYAPYWLDYLKQENILYRLLGLNTIYSYAMPNQPLAKDASHCPVIIYSHGIGRGIRNINTAICEDLASHGYVVVGISHPYTSYVVEFPDGRKIPNIIVEKELNFQQRKAIADREIEIWMADAKFVLDQVERESMQHGSIFCGHLDLNRIGMFGHSFGGATAAQTCRHDARCKAGINMDGALFGPDKEQGFNKPFMVMVGGISIEKFSMPIPDEKEMLKRYASREEENESMQKFLPAISRFIQNMQSDAYKIVLAGADHNTFCDLALLKSGSSLVRFIDLHTGFIDGLRAHTIISSYIRAFFDCYLCGKRSPLLYDDEGKPSEVTLERKVSLMKLRKGK